MYFWAFSNNLYNQYLPSGSPPSPVSWNPEISLELFIFNAKFESTSSIVSITSPEAILHYSKINLIEGFLLSLTLQKHYTTTCFQSAKIPGRILTGKIGFDLPLWHKHFPLTHLSPPKLKNLTNWWRVRRMKSCDFFKKENCW